ncbi:MAG: ABC transporter permease [Planctomycetaceae bacterium]|nr:ABC transporter permease [Planctomycetaceae bacterium]
MRDDIVSYFHTNSAAFFAAVREHILVSLAAFLVAFVIAVPTACLSVKYRRLGARLAGGFQALRIVPSLAVLLLLLPILGIGYRPAVVALTLLAIPPILLNAIAGLDSVPPFMMETAAAVGMTRRESWLKVKLPLAMPLVLAGCKIAAIEIIASATLAAKIGAGGLGEIIFTGLGLNRPGLLVVGGAAVAALSLSGSVLFTIVERAFFRHGTA